MFAARRLALRALSSPIRREASCASARSFAHAFPTQAIRPHPLPITSALGRRGFADEGSRDRDEYLSDAEAKIPVAEDDIRPERKMAKDTRRPSYTPDKFPPSNKIYVGNLFYDLTESDLKKRFEKFGPITAVNIQFDHRGLSKGHAYIDFETLEDAERAVAEADETVLQGRRLKVNYRAQTRYSRPSERPYEANPPSRTLFIGNLSYEMTEKDLNDLFRDLPNIVDVRVAIDRRTGTPKGFAHADFEDVDSAQEGLNKLGTRRVYGRQLRVNFSGPMANRRVDPSQSNESGRSETEDLPQA